ncbi:MAG: hypothetical protein EBY64_05330 [Rhodobacteraceae bacterium]|nr:hypothetical protein [Paracoccaceae bacterium]
MPIRECKPSKYQFHAHFFPIGLAFKHRFLFLVSTKEIKQCIVQELLPMVVTWQALADCGAPLV